MINSNYTEFEFNVINKTKMINKTKINTCKVMVSIITMTMILTTYYLYNSTTCSVISWSLSLFVQLYNIFLFSWVICEIHKRYFDNFKLCFDVLTWVTITISFLSFLRQIWYCSLLTIVITGMLQIIIKWCILVALAEDMCY